MSLSLSGSAEFYSISSDFTCSSFLSSNSPSFLSDSSLSMVNLSFYDHVSPLNCGSLPENIVVLTEEVVPNPENLLLSPRSLSTSSVSSSTSDPDMFFPLSLNSHRDNLISPNVNKKRNSNKKSSETENQAVQNRFENPVFRAQGVALGIIKAGEKRSLLKAESSLEMDKITRIECPIVPIERTSFLTMELQSLNTHPELAASSSATIPQGFGGMRKSQRSFNLLNHI